MKCKNCGRKIDVHYLAAKIAGSKTKVTTWTKQEDDMIRFTLDMSVEDAAKALDRTKSAIEKRRTLVRKNIPIEYPVPYIPTCECGKEIDKDEVLKESSILKGKIMTDKKMKAIRKMVEQR